MKSTPFVQSSSLRLRQSCVCMGNESIHEVRTSTRSPVIAYQCALTETLLDSRRAISGFVVASTPRDLVVFTWFHISLTRTHSNTRWPYDTKEQILLVRLFAIHTICNILLSLLVTHNPPIRYSYIHACFVS
jgi:hypothetical protein